MGCAVQLPRGTVTGHKNVGQSTSGLKSAIASQPVSVTVNAGQLQLYSNGVVTGDCSGQINHAVIAVGYGTDDQDYFKIRNSWGTSWGEAGNIRVAQMMAVQEPFACSMRIQLSQCSLELLLKCEHPRIFLLFDCSCH